MKAQIHIVEEVHAILSIEEARYLRCLLQNPINNQPEVPQDTRVREAIFTALQEAEKS